MANTSIQLKKSGLTGNVPASLAYGELALNYADGKLFYKHANGSIASISTGSLTNSFATINANSSLVLATSPTDTLSIVPGNNITISTDTVSKTITINSVSAGSAADQFARDTANTAAANTIILQGVNTTQNTNITTANNAAWAAFAKANSALSNTSGAIFGGDLTVTGNLTTGNIVGTSANTTIVAGAYTTTFDTAGVITHTGDKSATSNATGALVIAGGVGIKSNVYTGNIVITGTTSNGITFADGTRQTTAATGGGGGSLTVNNDITSNTAKFINFTDSTSGAVSTINTSSNNLTYVPETGTLKTLALNVTANTNISANSATVVGTSQQVLDSFSTELYRGAFYQIQMETSSGFQVLNISIVNSESSAQVTTFGDAYNVGVLATFDASVSGGLVQLKITPTQSSTTVSYLRHALVKLTAGIPSGDMGFVADATTATFDAGFDLDATTSTYDYGFVS